MTSSKGMLRARRVIWARWAQGQRWLVYKVTRRIEKGQFAELGTICIVESCTFRSNAIAEFSAIGDVMSICRHGVV